MQYASVGAIAFTERFQPLRDMNGDFVRDEFGNIVFGFVTAPIIAFFTQNVPGAEIQGFELEYDWRPWNGGRIYGYATWLDTEITDSWTTKWNYDPVSYFGLNFEQSVDPTNPVLEVNMQGNELAVSPEFGLRMTVEHAFFFQGNIALIPWVTASWEDDSYLTIWNVDKHTDDMDFVILDEDIRYTDDKREAWSMIHAGVRLFSGDWTAELYAYNLTNEVVQYWGGSAEQVSKGSFCTPRTYGFRFAFDF
jgi:iron complex outermembrane receptor protein